MQRNQSGGYYKGPRERRQSAKLICNSRTARESTKLENFQKQNKKDLGKRWNASSERKCVKDDSNVFGFGDCVLPSTKTWNSEEVKVLMEL